MAEVRVHHADDVGGGDAEAGDDGGAEAELAGAMDRPASRCVRASSSAIAPVPSGELSSTITSSSSTPAVAAALEQRVDELGQPIASRCRSARPSSGRPARADVTLSTIIQAVSRRMTRAPRDTASPNSLDAWLLASDAALRLPALVAARRRRSEPLSLRRPARARRRRAVRGRVGSEAAAASSSSTRRCGASGRTSRWWPLADLVAAAGRRPGCSSPSAAACSAAHGGRGAAALFLLLGSHPALSAARRRLRARPVRDVHRARRDRRARCWRWRRERRPVHAAAGRRCVSAPRSGSSTTRWCTSLPVAAVAWSWPRRSPGPPRLDERPRSPSAGSASACCRQRDRRSRYFAAHGALERLWAGDDRLQPGATRGETYAGTPSAPLVYLADNADRPRAASTCCGSSAASARSLLVVAVTAHAARLGDRRPRLDRRGGARRSRSTARAICRSTSCRPRRRWRCAAAAGLRRVAAPRRRPLARRGRRRPRRRPLAGRRRAQASPASGSAACRSCRESAIRSRLRPRQHRSRQTYLARFQRRRRSTTPPAVDALTPATCATTTPDERSDSRVRLRRRGVYAYEPPAERVAVLLEPAGRCWSSPRITPGYGSAGLLHDLQRTPPAVDRAAETGLGPRRRCRIRTTSSSTNTGLRAWLDAELRPRLRDVRCSRLAAESLR